MSPRPTHFLSLPLGQHRSLRTNLIDLIDSFFALDPPPAQLQRKHVEPPIRLHLTLGIMRLADEETLQKAVDLLESCRTPLLELLDGTRLSIRLDGLGCFPEGSVRKVRVLWARPSDPPGRAGLLESVASLVRSTFLEAGLITESKEPILHCTLIKAPPRRGDRFDGTSILPLPAELGTHEVDELRLCRMGAYDREGKHISAGAISLLREHSPQTDFRSQVQSVNASVH